MADKFCTQNIKDKMGVKQVCNQKLSDGDCPNRGMHLSSWQSGFCSIGAHEGLNPSGAHGSKLPTCTFWQTCSCSCHVMYDEMYQMTDTQRTAVNNSSYVKPPDGFVMPDMAEIAALRASSMESRVTILGTVESELPDVVPPTVARSFGPTNTGRAAKGELEYQVKESCDLWLIEAETFNCTPAWVSMDIGKRMGIKSPSVGAIDAVWKRWVILGFAEIAAKPTRFMRYTEEGIALTLEGCKERARRQRYLPTTR